MHDHLCGQLGDAGGARIVGTTVPSFALQEALHRFASSSAGTTSALGDTASRLAGALAGLADGLTGLTCHLAKALGRLPHIAYGLTCAFADVANCLSSAFADVADRLASTLADLTRGLTSPFAKLANRLPRSCADVLDGSASTLADVLDRLAGLAESPPGAMSHVFDRPPQAFHELWIAVDGGENPIDDCRDTIQPDFQQSLRLDAFDVDSELAEMRVDPRVEFDQVENLRLQSNTSIEVVEL
ncbi:MAG TPA: hypothetical protein VHQ43_01025 [Solirubrobacterales bacterium]|nr:hypothetical protein [Solirubrobacterales bacterium]